jgi:DNA-binding NarL/FixJ family response regulator
MTTRQLRAAEASYRKAQGRSEDLRIKRNLAVLTALRDGMAPNEVAEATGLSRGRIAQISSRGMEER